MKDWKSELTPRLRYPAYLNHASIAPTHERARTAMMRLMDMYAESGVKAWSESLEIRKRLRTNLARLIQARPEDIGLIPNTSYGLMLAACEYPWRSGDSLVLIRGEFPGNVVPWLTVADRHNLKVLWLEPEELSENHPQFIKVMRARPRLMAISWVQYQTGRTLPLSFLARIREKFGVHICVDAIQGLGPLVMDLKRTPVDFVVCGGHKWLLSAEGTGFMYIHPERMAELRPVMVSWLSQEDPVSFLFRGAGLVDYRKPFRREAERVEMATMNNLGFAGMEASIGLILEAGPHEVEARIGKLAEQCRSGLKSLGVKLADPEARAGIVSFKLDSVRLKAYSEHLEKEGVIVATPDGHLRASPHFYNEPGDIDLFLKTVAYLIEHDRPSS